MIILLYKSVISTQNISLNQVMKLNARDAINIKHYLINVDAK